MHTIIVGMTESGKTTLAKIVARELKKRGHKIAVLDPLYMVPGWEADFATDDGEKFLEYAKTNTDHFLFVDEGGTSIGKYDTEMDWLGTTARHAGHSSFFIIHRATQLRTNIRLNASKAYVFATDQDSASILAKEWNEPMLRKLPKIQPGEFFIVSRFVAAKRGRVDFVTGKVYDMPVYTDSEQAETVVSE